MSRHVIGDDPENVRSFFLSLGLCRKGEDPGHDENSQNNPACEPVGEALE